MNIIIEAKSLREVVFSLFEKNVFRSLVIYVFFYFFLTLTKSHWSSVVLGLDKIIYDTCQRQLKTLFKGGLSCRVPCNGILQLGRELRLSSKYKEKWEFNSQGAVCGQWVDKF